MSANGALSSTLDFTFFGGGVIQVTGGISEQQFPLTLVSSAAVPVVGTLETFNLDFTFSSAITAPVIQASATNLSFGFTGSGFIEFGIQTFGTAGGYEPIFEYTANSAGQVVVSGIGDFTVPFNIDTNIFVFSEGPATGTISYTLNGAGINVSRRRYEREGGNTVRLNDDYNGVRMLEATNGVRITDNGVRAAEVIQN